MARARAMRGVGPAGRPQLPNRADRILGRTARSLGVGVLGLLSALSGPACTGSISGGEGTTGQGNTGAGASSSGSGNAGATASGHGGSGAGTGTEGAGTGTGTGGTDVVQCNAIAPGRAPIRRLTTYEYNNTIRDLLGDTTSPGSALPPQVDSGLSLFGNDADDQSPESLLVEKYQTVSESVAARGSPPIPPRWQVELVRDERDHGERGGVRANNRHLAGPARLSAYRGERRESTSSSHFTRACARSRPR